MRVLVCTDVWADYFTDRNASAATIARVFEKVEQEGGTLLTAISSLQDIFDLVAAYVPSSLAQDGEQTSEASIHEVAWGCLRLVRTRSAVVGLGLGECFEAETFRFPQGTFADAMMFAAARRGEADLMLSERDVLCAVSPVSVCSVRNLAAALGVEMDDESLEVER
ncbi:MAG: hypothetical protein IJ781_10115 [Atopobiaceae bacterium]|nr:hypothetical protein [Atopobiaceae bacterium]